MMHGSTEYVDQNLSWISQIKEIERNGNVVGNVYLGAAQILHSCTERVRSVPDLLCPMVPRLISPTIWASSRPLRCYCLLWLNCCLRHADERSLAAGPALFASSTPACVDAPFLI